jgi:hypothetical protein
LDDESFDAAPAPTHHDALGFNLGPAHIAASACIARCDVRDRCAGGALMLTPHKKLYHFTCTARLPWIIDANDLRPYRNQIGGLPGHDMLWATTSNEFDPAASGLEAYREQVAALVRLTLSADGFEPWPTIITRLSQSTIENVRRLEADARAPGQVGSERWHAQAEPLPLSRIICAEAKTYTGSWQAIELPCLHHVNDMALRGIILDDKVYCSHRPKGTAMCIPAIVSLADWPLYDCLTRGRRTSNLKFERFSDEQWQALLCVRDDWPDGVDWWEFRRDAEIQGWNYWKMHEGRKKYGKRSAIRKRLKAAERHLRKMQAELKSLPNHVTHSAPDLASMDQWLQDSLSFNEILEERFAYGFAGRSDYYRDMLCEWLLVEWVNTLGGELSYSRRLDGTPYGPFIDFLSIVMTAILGRAPGPSGLAKIIDQYRKADD